MKQTCASKHRSALIGLGAHEGCGPSGLTLDPEKACARDVNGAAQAGEADFHRPSSRGHPIRHA
jgi:hypothetical protein